MQSTTATRSTAHVAFTVAQSIPELALSRREEMALLGISIEDFADRAHDLPLVESEVEVEAELPTLPLYRETPGADVAAYTRELGLLWSATRRAGMNEATRIEGAAKYLQLALTSWKQMNPESMRRLRYAIEAGQLGRDWAPIEKSAARRVDVSDLGVDWG